MSRNVIGLVVVGGVAAFVTGGLWLQRAATAALRVERDGLREQVREATAARAENERLRARQVSAVQLETLHTDRAAANRLRGEIGTLKKQASQPAPPAAARPPVKLTPASEWKNAGRGSPAAAVETVFWAAAGGDLDALAATVAFEGKARALAEAFFAGQAEPVKQQYGTPERLVAAFTAKDIPLSAMRIVGQKENGPDDVTVSVLFEVPDAKPRAALLTVHRDERGWRLRVPEAALQSYTSGPAR